MTDRATPRRPERRAWRLAVLYWGIVVLLAAWPRHSGNVWSRYLTIESVVERGTLAVDRSPLLGPSGTPDLVMFDGRLYSDKPPVLSMLGVLVYAPLWWAGIALGGSAWQFIAVNWVLVATFAASSAALTLVAFRYLVGGLGLDDGEADVLTLGLGFGTLLLPYAVTFNNHVVAAACTIGAFALVQREPEARWSPRWRLWAGALGGLAAVVDMPAGGAVLVALGAWLGVRGRGLPWAYVLGASGPLLLHAAVQSMVTGTPLPAEAYPGAFLYPGSYWATPAGAIRETGPRWRFALEFLVGPQGWLTVTPVLAAGVVGLIAVAARRDDRLRPAAIVVGAVTVTVIGYYVCLTRRTDFAGQSFGTRHLLAISPLVYYFAAVLLARSRSRAVRLAFVVLGVVGLAYAVLGTSDPWTRIESRGEPAVRALQRFVVYPWSSYSR